MRVRWASWRSFETVVSPKHITEPNFVAVRDLSPFVTNVMVAYGYGQVSGLVTSAANLIKDWTDADNAFLRSSAKVSEMQAALKDHLELACKRIEELLLLAGHVARLTRLLGAVRSLQFIVGEGCHHYATKVIPVLRMLAAECEHDLVEECAGSARALSADLGLDRLPPNIRRYFEEARDNLLLQHDELGAFAACRGFERGCKLVASTHSLTLGAANAPPRPLADCDLHDVIEAFFRARWSDGSNVLDRTDRALVQFVRQMRNVAGHGSISSVDEWRETAVLAAAATCRLMERSSEPGQTITPSTITKSW